MVLQTKPIKVKSEQEARFDAKVQDIFDKSFVGINLSRKKFMFALMCALIEKKSVRFDELAKVLNFDAKDASNKRRIQSFFSDFNLLMEQVALFIMLLVPMRKFVLSLDRTNWKFGDQNFNILCLCIEYRGVGIPIYWEMLDKRGNSNESERIDLLRAFIKEVGKDRIACLTADREFIGEKWLKFLVKEGITFYIRIKSNFNVYDQQGNFIKKAGQLSGKYGATFKKNVIINGVKVDIAAKKLTQSELKQQKQSQEKQLEIQEDKYLIVITNGDVDSALSIYKKRWSIEVFFQSVKSRGFNLEQTHLTSAERLGKLFGIVAMAFTWCLVVGVWKDEWVEQIPRTCNGYKTNSFFRVGLDTIGKAIRRYAGEKGRGFNRIIDFIYDYIIKIYFTFGLDKKIIT